VVVVVLTMSMKAFTTTATTTTTRTISICFDCISGTGRTRTSLNSSKKYPPRRVIVRPQRRHSFDSLFRHVLYAGKSTGSSSMDRWNIKFLILLRRCWFLYFVFCANMDRWTDIKHHLFLKSDHSAFSRRTASWSLMYNNRRQII
jgi:hypothetical protein